MTAGRGPFDPVEGSRDRRPFSTWAWIGPAVAAGIFLVVLGILLSALQSRDAAEKARAIEVDSAEARESIARRLNADRNFLLSVSDDLAGGLLDEVVFQSRVTRYVSDHPEIVSVRWLSPDLALHRQAPAGPSRPAIGSRLSGAETVRAVRLALSGRKMLWTRPFGGPDGSPVFELWIPVHRDGQFRGLIGATFSVDLILRRTLPAPVLLDYRVTLEDHLGGVIATLPSAGRVEPGVSRRVTLDPPGYGVSLLLERYGSTLWGWGMTVLAATCVALAVGLGFGMWSLARTIVTRQRAEEALRASNEALNALIDASPLAIVVLDGAGNVAMWNRAARDLFGWSQEELLGRPNPTVPPERWDEYLGRLRKAFGGGHDAVEAHRVRRDGVPVEVRASAAPLRDASGSAGWVIEVLADVTRERMIEERLRESQKMEAVGRLAGGVAHDFNNLLTAILGYSDLLMHRLPEQDPARREVEEILGAAERAAALTRRLLAFGRKQVMQPKRVDLNEVVAGLQGMLSGLAGEEIELKVETAPGPLTVYADPGQLEQAVVDLASNARDAMPGGGRLAVSTKSVEIGAAAPGATSAVPPGRYAVLSVKDSGRGMDEETRSHLFEPFFTTKERGKGLGLSAVYGTVAQSGGQLEVDSAPGEGTEFRILLPRLDAEAPAPAGDPAARPPEGSVYGGTETVLVAEDESVIRMLVVGMLRRLGYTALEAADGVEALRVAEEHDGPIHLLLTDVVMPRMGGKELADRLAPLRPGMRVLFMSGYPDDDLGAHGVLPEHVAFLAKPFTPSGVAKAVRELLDPAERR